MNEAVEPVGYLTISHNNICRQPGAYELFPARYVEHTAGHYADPSRAGVIIPVEQEENEDLLMLLMPMMLND